MVADEHRYLRAVRDRPEGRGKQYVVLTERPLNLQRPLTKTTTDHRAPNRRRIRRRRPHQTLNFEGRRGRCYPSPVPERTHLHITTGTDQHAKCRVCRDGVVI